MVILLAACRDTQRLQEDIFLSMSTVNSFMCGLGEEINRNQDGWTPGVRLPYNRVLDCENSSLISNLLPMRGSVTGQFRWDSWGSGSLAGSTQHAFCCHCGVLLVLLL